MSSRARLIEEVNTSRRFVMRIGCGFRAPDSFDRLIEEVGRYTQDRTESLRAVCLALWDVNALRPRGDAWCADLGALGTREELLAHVHGYTSHGLAAAVERPAAAPAVRATVASDLFVELTRLYGQPGPFAWRKAKPNLLPTVCRWVGFGFVLPQPVCVGAEPTPHWEFTDLGIIARGAKDPRAEPLFFGADKRL